MSKPKRDFRFFERWARRNGMMPIQRITDVTVNGKVVGDILVADSQLMLTAAGYPNDEHDLPMFYRTGFAIDRGSKTWIAAFNDYPPDAFSEYAGDSRQDARVKDCIANAVRTLQQTHEAGLYRGNDRRVS